MGGGEGVWIGVGVGGDEDVLFTGQELEEARGVETVMRSPLGGGGGVGDGVEAAFDEGIHRGPGEGGDSITDCRSGVGRGGIAACFSGLGIFRDDAARDRTSDGG